MKKAMLLAVCLILAGLLAVNGTFASDFSKTISDVFADLTNKLGEAFGIPEADEDVIDVALVSDDMPQQLYPGGTAVHSVAVQNCGSGDVYFRLAYAVQYDAETWPLLHISFSADDSVYTGLDDAWKEIDVSGKPYMMKVLTYTSELVSGSKASAVQMTVSLEPNITSEQIAGYDKEFVKIQALAIETKGFNDRDYDTAIDALNEALPLTDFNPF